jgi:hypothetical protein
MRSKRKRLVSPLIFSSGPGGPCNMLGKYRRCGTELNKNGDLEEMLAQDVRSYLLVCGGREESERQQLRTVCATLARLLGQLLQGNEKWSVYYWVDDILPISTTVVSGELKVQGLMIWGNANKHNCGSNHFQARCVCRT